VNIFKADVIVWDLARAKSLCDSGKVIIGDDCFVYRLKQHLGKVQDLGFSAGDEYICTLGGADDNAIVVWNASTGTAICGAPAGPDAALSVKWFHGRSDRFVSAGTFHVRVWQVDFSLPKLHSIDVKMGTVRRVATCMSITDNDEFAYCGTETGDILKIKIDRDEIRSFNDPDTKIPSLAAGDNNAHNFFFF
jgi:WD40 repeat protein